MKDKKKQAILNTTYTTWVQEDDGTGYHVCASPLATHAVFGFDVLGTGDTPEAARALFESLLNDTLESYYKGELAVQRGVGQPAKANKSVLFRITHSTMQAIDAKAKALGITRGEYVEYLVASTMHNAPQINPR